MLEVNIGKDLILAITLSKSKYITPLNKFFNKSVDERFYHGSI